MWLGSAPKKNRVRARADFFLFFLFFEFQGIFMSLSAYFSQKEKKKVARANPGARGNPNDFLLLLM